MCRDYFCQSLVECRGDGVDHLRVVRGALIILLLIRLVLHYCVAICARLARSLRSLARARTSSSEKRAKRSRVSILVSFCDDLQLFAKVKAKVEIDSPLIFVAICVAFSCLLDCTCAFGFVVRKERAQLFVEISVSRVA